MRSFKIYLTDTVTGEERLAWESDETEPDFRDPITRKMWTRGAGNYGCDCNRYLMFYDGPRGGPEPPFSCGFSRFTARCVPDRGKPFAVDRVAVPRKRQAA
jgi:hypothetical protein